MRRTLPILAATFAAAAIGTSIWLSRVERPMWPAAKFSFKQRDEALRRGLNFIYQKALEPTTFAENGADLLSCFYMTADVATDPQLREMAKSMGLERAKAWRAAHASLPDKLDVDTICDYAFGSMSADYLGLPDAKLKDDIRIAARRFTPQQYLRFDPAKEGPPTDIPHRCSKCKRSNPRGTKTCGHCGHALTMFNRYDIMFDALVTTYSGDRYGIWLGGTFGDVVQWIPSMRPYPAPKAHDNDFDSTAYLVTHIIYTLNDYDLYRLKREWLPEEYDFLRAWFHLNLDAGDAETLGEFMDSLRSLGVENTDPQLRQGIEYLLSHQNSDGSWGSSKANVYTRYHTTWTAMAGLIDYVWRGERLSFPEVLPRLLRQPPKP